ncbi:Uncharacterized protein OBRU01_07472 [Operophtera brumata]|uniref:Uncharacterized protein n=1 Tax=Operophtera brumata TaxID=104452 RepID=A0A0L7L999_OPEBR|nr:Uncharacterized protein OBRU01_07472 [Operophtera brumata]
MKKEICFGETLIISCGHYDGDIGENSSDSEWSCHGTSETETSQAVKDEVMFEVKDRGEEEADDEQVDEEPDNFQFYFFPDCKKPQLPQDSKDSLLVVDGLPKLNPVTKGPKIICTCGANHKGKCICHTKLPCRCGAKTKMECTCLEQKQICICHDAKPMPVCLCKGSDICLCHPDGKIRPSCTCDTVDKPCICHPGKYPSPVCTCGPKPKFNFDDLESIDEVTEVLTEDDTNIAEVQAEVEAEVGNEAEAEDEMEMEQCQCQKPDPKPHCMCLKGKDCTCTANSCICGVQETCVCEPTDSQESIICKNEDSKSICSCPIPRECTCDAKTDDCKCFPKKHCSCGDPENCICFTPCDCTEPCICETAVQKPTEYICLTKSKYDVEGVVCICERDEEESKKLKRVRAGKHGYRWCPDIDPRHTYFDYAYDRHDKVSHKPEERQPVEILGLHDVTEEEDVCAIHGVKAPPYKKKIRKPSIDCCSAVGGISICVEVLGEDRDKFLVQVVSSSSKEGAKTGSKLVGILDSNLHTLEENRTDYMAICESGYYNKITRICGDRHVVKRHYHTFEDSRNFLLEAANIVLLRYIGLRRYRGNIKTETVLIDGMICEKGARYISESGALTGTVRDYLQALLLLRPHDALHFTRHYFGAALSSLDLPRDEYFEPTSKHVRYYFFEQ